MFTHVTVGANDIEASRQFYDAALGALGIDPASGPDPKGRYWWRTPRGAFAVGKPIDGAPACHANGGTIGFAAADLEAVAAFQAAGRPPIRAATNSYCSASHSAAARRWPGFIATRTPSWTRRALSPGWGRMPRNCVRRPRPAASVRSS